MSSAVFQLVRFRLREGVADREFLEATARAGLEFLAHQRGFLGRDVYRAADGLWVGVLHWDSQASMDAATTNWRAHPLAEALDPLVDSDGLTMETLRHEHRDPPGL